MRYRLTSGAEDDRPFWRQRGWQLSAGFLVFVLCAGLIAAVHGGPDPAPGVGRPANAGPLSQRLGAESDRPGDCRTDDADQGTPVRPPADVTWRQLNGAGVPLSASAGPLRTTGAVQWCFAHTPMGAVMAANVIPRHMSGAEWRSVTAQQVVPGIDRDIFVAMRSSQQDAPVRYTANSLAGFLLMSYAADLATVRLLIRQVPATYGVTDYTVQWQGGDWKLRPLAGGDLHTPVTPVPDATGFVLWAV